MTDQDPVPVEHAGIMLRGKAYDFVVFLVQVVLPGLATLYFTLAGIWGLPAAEQVMGTITAVAVFLGLFLRLSNKNFHKSTAAYDGQMVISLDQGGMTGVSMELDDSPELLEYKDKVTFKVKKVAA